MLTAFLILALVLTVLASIGIVGFCIGQGFWFWLFVGQDAFKACAYVVVAIAAALFDSNS